MDDTERILELIETIDALKAEVARLRWIPVGERLPDDEHVLALSQYGAIPHRIIPGGLLGATSEVTHWMPLPAAPGGDLPPCPTCGSEGRGGGLPYCNDCDPDAAPEGD